MFDAVAYLTRQHTHCDHAFLAVEKAAQAKDWDKVDTLFDVACTALHAHLQLEEQVLFPAFERATGIVGGPTAMMCGAHEVMRDILANVTACARYAMRAAYWPS
ncbi:MAG: hemerythrin domain-containing protein [Burkholderiales bacterium]|nr:hemerythrin domain-containing protein [Burkholderiales bacterium]